jgi:hypothetical protein
MSMWSILVCSSTTLPLPTANVAVLAASQKFLLFWERKVPHVLAKRLWQLSGDGSAVVQQQKYGCTWRSEAGLVYFRQSAFSHRHNLFKKQIHLLLALPIYFILLLYLVVVFDSLLEFLNNSLMSSDSARPSHPIPFPRPLHPPPLPTLRKISSY